MFFEKVTVAGYTVHEGSERKSIPDFQRFTNIAQGSAADLRTQVYISREVIRCKGINSRIEINIQNASVVA